MTLFPVGGGCLCGAVQFTLLAPVRSVQHCHCSLCRRATGHFFASGAVVRRDDLNIDGSENLTTYFTSPSFGRQFCRTCGCHLFSTEHGDQEFMYLSPATLDGGVHPGHPPEKESHTYVASKAEWDRIPDGIAQFDENSPDEIVTAIQRPPP